MCQSTEMGQVVLEAVRKVTYCDRGPDGTCVWSLGQRPEGTGSEAIMWKWPTVTEARRNRVLVAMKKVTHCNRGQLGQVLETVRKMTHYGRGQTGQVLETEESYPLWLRPDGTGFGDCEESDPLWLSPDGTGYEDCEESDPLWQRSDGTGFGDCEESDPLWQNSDGKAGMPAQHLHSRAKLENSLPSTPTSTLLPGASLPFPSSVWCRVRWWWWCSWSWLLLLLSVGSEEIRADRDCSAILARAQVSAGKQKQKCSMQRQNTARIKHSTTRKRQKATGKVSANTHNK